MLDSDGSNSCRNQAISENSKLLGGVLIALAAGLCLKIENPRRVGFKYMYN